MISLIIFFQYINNFNSLNEHIIADNAVFAFLKWIIIVNGL